MPETRRVEGGAEATTEEIVEKKPSAPLAVALLIISTVCIGFTIYLELDWLDGFFSKKDYDAKPQIEADYYFNAFKKKLRKPEEVKPDWLIKALRGG